ncbi:hypothetical protein DRE_03288 [Drechslerella stenobrocha 248]|uniref:Ribosomal RNA-processing protein 42 n=1 Tax=Drechslerella stenobrocha 248 TaxID=1043628 RepID=W7I676_9PEZI|nr:hypothetical protein DRE_03288 [Drechslerella stenobrocha 248]
MPPPTPLSPPELSYLYTSLTLSPPIRPDLRAPSQFRPIVAECSFLPHCNGSARICMAEAGECIVGIKAEVEKDRTTKYATIIERDKWIEVTVEVAGGGASGPGSGVGVGGISGAERRAVGGWSSDIGPVLLLTPTSHPSPLLLSAAANVALDSTFLPKLTSPHEVDDIPAFSDDWAISTPLYEPATFPRPPISLPIVAVGDNVFLDPSVAEVAAAEVGLVVTLTLADSEGNCDLVGVRGMEVGRGGGKEGERKGTSRKLLRQMVDACIREAGDVIKGLGESTRQQMFRA